MNKFEIQNKLLKICNEIKELSEDVDDRQLQIDLIRVLNDMRLATDNYFLGVDKKLSNYKLMEIKTLIENINNLVDDIIVNNK